MVAVRPTLAVGLAAFCFGCAAPAPASTAQTLAQICANPHDFDGHTIELTVTNVQLSDRACTAVRCTAARPCCNDCTSWYYLSCPGGGVLGLAQGHPYAFGCSGNDCNRGCTVNVAPSDVLRFTATIHVGGPPATCCVPVEIGLAGSVAYFEMSSYSLNTSDAGS